MYSPLTNLALNMKDLFSCLNQAIQPLMASPVNDLDSTSRDSGIWVQDCSMDSSEQKSSVARRLSFAGLIAPDTTTGDFEVQDSNQEITRYVLLPDT